MTMPDQETSRKFQEQLVSPERRLLAERSVQAMNYQKKLETSLGFRQKNKKDTAAVSDEIGTAEHRPRQGLVYDAPLGLKF